MKAKDNAQNGTKKGDRTSREKLITAIVAAVGHCGGRHIFQAPHFNRRAF